jgi:hypothetical protein
LVFSGGGLVPGVVVVVVPVGSFGYSSTKEKQQDGEEETLFGGCFDPPPLFSVPWCEKPRHTAAFFGK